MVSFPDFKAIALVRCPQTGINTRENIEEV